MFYVFLFQLSRRYFFQAVENKSFSSNFWHKVRCLLKFKASAWPGGLLLAFKGSNEEAWKETQNFRKTTLATFLMKFSSGVHQAGTL